MARVPPRNLCSKYRCTTIAADSKVQVYKATSRHPGRETYDATFARWLPTGRVTSLGEFAGEVDSGATVYPAEVSVAGAFIAYGLLESKTGKYPGSGFAQAVYRLNVRTGRRERTPAAGAGGTIFGEKSLGATDIVLTPAGSVAWIVDGSYNDPSNPHTLLPLGSKTVLYLQPGSRTPTVLSTSATINPKSLAAIPGNLYWLEGQTARTAPIQ
jgi:hypothetical protein